MEFISIFIQDKDNQSREIKLPNDSAYSLMEMLRASELPIAGTCDGLALCASCHVFIHSDNDLPLMNTSELQLLDSLPNSKSNSRLSCQLRMNESLHNLVIEIASE